MHACRSTLEDPTGLARFDGASFVAYGARDGLASTVASALAEDARGDIWFGAHSAGIARIRCASAAERGRRVELFQVGAEASANSVEDILFTDGGAWIASAGGVWRMTLDGDGAPSFALRWKAPAPFAVQAIVRQGERAWVLSARERIALGPRDELRVEPGAGSEPGFDVVARPGPDGRALLCTGEGVVEFAPPDRYAPVALPLASGVRVKATAIAADGTCWVGTTAGLLRVGDGGVERIGRGAGLASERISSLLLDRSGRLWIGTHEGGLCVLPASTPVSHLFRGERVNVNRIARGLDGRVYAAGLGVYAVGDAGLELVAGTDRPPLARTEGFFHRDSAGAFWFGCESGLYRTSGPELDVTRLEGPLLAGPCAGVPVEDAHGALWVSGAEHAVHVRRGDGAFERVLDWPSVDDGVREAHVDRAGRIWLVGWNALWRRDGERSDAILVDGDAPQVRAFLEDRRGRVWLGLRHGGLAWTDEPGAAAPRFARMRSADGLPSDTVWALAEDASGALWLGTGRGLARFAPDGGALALWTEADGLGGGAVFDVLCADDGSVWAATSGGVAHVDPRAAPAPPEPPTVVIAAFEAGGEPRPLPETGVGELSGIVLAPEEDEVVVRFGAVDLLQGADLRFQTRLGSGAWSAPSPERSLHLARLEPGDYALEVRALARNGTASTQSARASFRLLAPLWRRPWFLALAGAGLCAGAFALHRARVGRMIALERVRTEIASDLHDEVGSGLAQISILSEVARRAAAPAVAERLGEVAELARATRASMSDLVWAIHPEKDRLGELVARLQDACEQTLAPAALRW